MLWNRGSYRKQARYQFCNWSGAYSASASPSSCATIQDSNGRASAGCCRRSLERSSHSVRRPGEELGKRSHCQGVCTMKKLLVFAVTCVLLGCGAAGLSWIPTGGGVTFTPDGGVTACIT